MNRKSIQGGKNGVIILADDLLQDENSGNMSERWRKECRDEFIVVEYRKHKLGISKRFSTPRLNI